MRACIAAGLLLVGCACPAAREKTGETTNAPEIGGRQPVNGGETFTWSRRGSDGGLEVGVTLPRKLIEDPPGGGPGPAGAIVVLPFSRQVQDSTLFDHFELHWEAHGHTPAHFEVPHFDFHFFAIPLERVRQVSATEPPPAPDRLPEGYVYLGAEGFIPEMGTHAVDPKVLEQPFELVMIEGIVDGRLAFLEPMALREWLLQKPTRTMEVPAPASLGRQTTLFPRAFALRFLPQADAYELAFSRFEKRD